MASSELQEVRISDYDNLKNAVVRRWLRKDRVPPYFLKRFSKVSSKMSVLDLIRTTDKELMHFYGGKRDYALSFEDSRFTPIPQMLKRGMVSCGSMVAIFTAVMRNFGIPVKMVHGRVKTRGRWWWHAWIKVYNPKENHWTAIDVTRHHTGFNLKPKTRQLRIYENWKHLRMECNRLKRIPS